MELNKLQADTIRRYCQKYGGVDVKETPIMVQLRLDRKMVTMEGITFGWLQEFSKCFFEISVGVPSHDSEKWAMYITLFKTDPFSNEI